MTYFLHQLIVYAGSVRFFEKGRSCPGYCALAMLGDDERVI